MSFISVPLSALPIFDHHPQEVVDYCEQRFRAALTAIDCAQGDRKTLLRQLLLSELVSLPV